MRENDGGLKDRFINTMQTRILSGELKPGDALPPERELAKQLGISRGSVNQGILDMERMGFVRIVPRKGSFVADYIKNATPVTLSAIMSYDSELVDGNLFKDLMDMRILIERECARLACKNVNTAAVKELCERNGQIHGHAGEALVEALYGYHLCIVKISGNAAYSMVFQSFEKMLKNLMQLHYSSENELKRNLPVYDALTAAISRGDSAEADELITRLLGSASAYLKLTLRGRGERT